MIKVIDVNFKYSQEIIYQNLNFNVYHNEHVVLVGPNGSGKSTVLKMLAKQLTPDQGSINILPNLKVGYLDQYMEIDEKILVKDYLYNVFSNLFELEDQMNNLYEEVKILTDETKIMNNINYASQIQEQLLDANFYQIKSSISNVMNGLGLGMDILNVPIKKLSSGMRAKVILGKLLLEENDILLLDEPTNFLDKIHIEWLTKFLKTYSKAFIVVSHHQEFLEDIAEVVLAIEQKQIERYRGNYQFYLREKDVRTALKNRNYEAQQRLIEKETEFINKNIARASTSKRAKSRRKMLEKIVRLEKINKELTYYFNFPTKLATGKDVLVVDNLEIGYDYPLVEPLSFTIRKEDKVAITGVNGIGKTTLIKTILKEINSLSGAFKWDKNVIFSYLAQDDFYLSNNSAFEVVNYTFTNLEKKEIYSLLATYGINFEMANRPINTLSGGEQMKIKLALMKNDFSNVLILDEPTNHLDVNAKLALQLALKEYQGTLILVSHEKSFYEEICDYEISLY